MARRTHPRGWTLAGCLPPRGPPRTAWPRPGSLGAHGCGAHALSCWPNCGGGAHVLYRRKRETGRVAAGLLDRAGLHNVLLTTA